MSKGIPQKISHKGVTYPSQKDFVNACGFSFKIVETAMKNYNYSIVEAVEFLQAFFSQYKGMRPNIITRVPYVIYNGVWYRNSKEFATACGVKAHFLNAAISDLGLRDPFVAMQYLANATMPLYKDKETGKLQTFKELRDNYFYATSQRAVLSGRVERIEVKRHENCHFDPSGYCATPLSDYKKLKEQLLNEEAQLA